MTESYYLVTYEWWRPGRTETLKRENRVIKGCPALWWKERIDWYDNYREKGREKELEYEARGEQVPISIRVESYDQRFLYATPISKEGYEALDGVVG